MGLGAGAEGVPGDVHGVQVQHPEGKTLVINVNHEETAHLGSAERSPSSVWLLLVSVRVPV